MNLDGTHVKGKGVVEPDKEAVKVVSGALNAVSYLNLSTGLSNVTMGVPIRLLSIDKVEPEPANVSTGAYPLRRPIVLVTKSPAAPAAKAFNDEFAAFCRRFGLPTPRINTIVCGYEVDAYFEEERLIWLDSRTALLWISQTADECGMNWE